MSLRAMLLLLLACVVVPLVALFSVGITLQLQDAEQTAQRESRNLAGPVAARLEERFQSLIFAQQLMQSVSVLPAQTLDDVSLVRERGCNAFLGRQASGLNVTRPVFNAVQDIKGRTICANVPPLPRNERVVNADRAYHRDLIANRTIGIGEVTIGRITNEPGIHIATPLRPNSDGSFNAYLVAAVDFAQVGEELAALPRPAGVVVLVTDRAGRIGAHSDDPGMVNTLLDADLFATFGDNPEGIRQTRMISGVPSIVAFNRITVTGRLVGYVVVIYPYTVVRGDTITFLVWVSIFFVIGIIAVLGLVYWGSTRFLLHPIRQLQATTQAIAHGDLSARPHVQTSTTELGQLALAIDQMASSLETERRETAVAQEQALAASQAELAAQARYLAAARESEALREQIIQEQQALLHELSSPIIPLMERVVVVPLIGSLREHRFVQIRDTVLTYFDHARIQVLLLDVTGVREIGDGVTQALIDLLNTIRLLGVRVVITGVQPAMAQAFVASGINLQDFVARSTLQAGIDYVLGKKV
ncbi:MAG: HAMP domain-containing protein [Chloroflexaceae bacterium]|nr:HAMP domain-containing protein [Chloroflexaceae bacterium]